MWHNLPRCIYRAIIILLLKIGITSLSEISLTQNITQFHDNFTAGMNKWQTACSCELLKTNSSAVPETNNNVD